MEKFNGLAVPPIVLWEELQERFCELSEGDTLAECVHDSCKTCLYFSENLNEFETWFKSKRTMKERIHNHEIWHECQKCGAEFDTRLNTYCPYCKTKVK